MPDDKNLDLTMTDTQGTENPDTQGTENPDTQGTENPDTKSIEGENSNMSKKQEKMVSVFIPKESRNDTERFVSVNGERLLIKTGIAVEVPERFAEVIRNSEKMAVVAAEFIEQNISNN